LVRQRDQDRGHRRGERGRAEQDDAPAEAVGDDAARQRSEHAREQKAGEHRVADGRRTVQHFDDVQRDESPRSRNMPSRAR